MIDTPMCCDLFYSAKKEYKPSQGIPYHIVGEGYSDLGLHELLKIKQTEAANSENQTRIFSQNVQY